MTRIHKNPNDLTARECYLLAYRLTRLQEKLRNNETRQETFSKYLGYFYSIEEALKEAGKSDYLKIAYYHFIWRHWTFHNFNVQMRFNADWINGQLISFVAQTGRGLEKLQRDAAMIRAQYHKLPLP